MARDPSVPRTPEDQVLVLFGATGDLAKRKLLPGLFHLAIAGMLPGRYRIVGSGRVDGAPSVSDFRTRVYDAIAQFGGREVSAGDWESFAPNLSFAAGSASEPGALVEAVAQAERALHPGARRLFYLAVPPEAFAPLVEMLGAAGLTERARLIVEKPFGTDVATARALNETLHRNFAEAQIFRIDHFLGKEAVQNILAFRFANGMFEPLWNREHVAYVQIDVPERLTIEGRAGFYEQTGAFRDMVVTHLLHLLSFIAMEPPSRLDAPSLREATGRVFDAVAPLDRNRAIFGQYDGYRSEAGVAARSSVETFAAVQVEVDNERWAGVPFLLRTGKALAQSRHTVTLGFKQPVHRLFGLGDPSSVRRVNELSFEFSEPGVIWVDFLAKQPGPTMQLGDASLTFRYRESFTVARQLEAYERLLHDAMLGDQTLFTSAAGIERLWEVATPLLEAPPTLLPYRRGSWGPVGIDELVAPHHWHLPYLVADASVLQVVGR